MRQVARQAAPQVKRTALNRWLPWLLVLVLLISVIALNYRLWIPADQGFQQIRQLQNTIQQQQQHNQQLQRRNDAVKADIRSLRHGLDAIEERARTDMGMIREGETFFRIVEPDEKP